MVSTLSLLDRLTDLEPELSRETPENAWTELRELRAALCRDLAVLLNTRRAAEPDFDPLYEDAANSILTFGVADFTSYNLKNAVEQERVRRSIENAIRRFEPRLARVSVALEQPDSLAPVLRFQINALLRIGSSAEPVIFDAVLHRESRRISVAGVNA